MKILSTADFHLRKDKPRCRQDDNWLDLQDKTLKAIVSIFKQENCDLLLIGGDIVETATVPPEITSMFLRHFHPIKAQVLILPGNHCLRYEDIKNIDKASYGLLRFDFGEFGHPFGTLIGEDNTKQLYTGIHELVWPSLKIKPEPAGGFLPGQVFDLFPNTEFIFTGDYHQAFTVKQGKQYLINPGCITRQNAKLKDYKPSVYVVDTNTKEITRHELPDTEPVVTDEYLRKEDERNERVDAFIELMGSSDKNVSLDFKANLELKFKTVNVKTDKPLVEPEVKKEIESILEEVA